MHGWTRLLTLSPIPGQGQLGGIWIPGAQDLWVSVLKLILSEGQNPQEFFGLVFGPLSTQTKAQFTFTDYVKASSSLEYVTDLTYQKFFLSFF